MKVGIITKPNAKGQIVIPKAIRDALGINSTTAVNLQVRGDGIYIHPIMEIVTGHETENSYHAILEKTAGSWRGDSWPKTERKQRKIELRATRLVKKAW